jgi:hypothetical protein
VPVEIALIDGTKLRTQDPNLKEDEVLETLAAADGSPGFVAFETENGTFRVNPVHVVYVRFVRV